MNTALAFLFLALGIVLDALHNKIRRESENRAYDCGYRQAQKEENIRLTASQKAADKGEQARLEIGHTPEKRRNAQVQAHVSEAEPMSSNIISATFWNDLQANGRAATRIQR